jgi:RimJ/RimL family protein N-acetyltransferase
MKTIIEYHKIYHVDSIYKKEIGYLQLIQTDVSPVYELEYWLDEKYHNKGYMSIQLPIYLKNIAKKGFTTIMAIVQEGNEASIKLLEKNGFFEFIKPKDNLRCFVVSLKNYN